MAKYLEDSWIDTTPTAPSGTPEQVAAAAKIEGLLAKATTLKNAGNTAGARKVLSQAMAAQTALSAQRVTAAQATVAANQKAITEATTALTQSTAAASTSEDDIYKAVAQINATDPTVFINTVFSPPAPT